MRSLPLVVSLVTLPAPALAQVTWTPGPEGPPVRQHHAVVYDAAREVVVVFGGRNLTGDLGDTWEWNGAVWTQRFPATAPAARAEIAMAYDENRQRVVLYGGWNASGFLGDTWEWDGVDWQRMAPSTRPGQRSRHAMAYDAARGVVVMFGGSGPNVTNLWEWDGVDWQRRAVGGPPGRDSAAMAYDRRRGRTVLFGGWRSPNFLSDTWEWDGSVWLQAAPATSPSSRVEHGMAYDIARGRIVLHAGQFGGNLADTWEWDGIDWIRRTPAQSPGPRFRLALAYDAARETTVLFGGSDGTVSWSKNVWFYGAIHQARADRFGEGCGSGRSPAPLLAPVPSQRPWLGESLALQVTGLASGAVPTVLLGRSRSSFAGISLPLKLAAVGLPGCVLYTSIDAVFPVDAAGGIANWSMPLCLCPDLLGSTLFNQVLVLEPGGIALTNATASVIGAK